MRPKDPAPTTLIPGFLACHPPMVFNSVCPMRYLALDCGQRRTGLAVGEDETGIVTPLHAIEASNEARVIERVVAEVESQGAEALVVGLPLNMDGTDSPQTKRIRQLAAQLHEAIDLPVYLFDERLSSFEADQRMSRSGLTHKQKKRRRDALAAAAILEDFLAQRD